MPRTARPSPDTIALTVTSPPSATERTVILGTAPFLPWPLAGAVGGMAAAAASWVLVVGVCLVAWFAALTTPLPELLAFSARLWLFGHGGGLVLDGTTITLMPLGLTAAGGVLAHVAGRFAGGQAALARPGMASGSETVRVAAAIAGLVAGGYALAAAVMVLAAGGPERDWTPVVGAGTLALVCGLAGAICGLGLGLADLRPRWLAAVLAGAATGLLSLLAAGAVVGGIATLLGAERIGFIESGLGLGASGGFVWAAIALAYLPNALVWALSWAIGGGFTIGAGSLVSLSGTQLGMLPAIPLLGALPSEGATSPVLATWLLLGVASGILAGVAAVRRLNRTGTGAASVLAALAVALVAGALAWTGLLAAAWASRGDLGALRLVDLGPRLAELAMISGPLIGISAVLGGGVCWALGAVRPGGSASVG
ncbi:MAG: DUF6350 family protein [Propionicimonas sp.]|uniref:cell division protein PerM n=1 Tax=Propionicimonas sp. TaxID=1955623 RepID=UPI002B21D1B2|nr:DUF6350 family protein [Propionicimonas sp.]MEA4944198.1 DUF6350 family protein [Propionicimonas sp.]MEA5052984.1 DUF6350 family protein [Propionicimonas sp.]MEA5119113.1 DUF6350 family protein [Propionicimonas sp.]